MEILNTWEKTICIGSYEKITIYYDNHSSSYKRQVQQISQEEGSYTRVYGEREVTVILEKIEDTKLNREKVILLTNE